MMKRIFFVKMKNNSNFELPENDDQIKNFVKLISRKKQNKSCCRLKKKKKQSLCSLPTISNSRGSQKSGSGIYIKRLPILSSRNLEAAHTIHNISQPLNNQHIFISGLA